MWSKKRWYTCVSSDFSSSKANSRGSTTRRLETLPSAAFIVIIGVLLHGTAWFFWVQFDLIHTMHIMLVISLTRSAHCLPSCAYARFLSRSVPFRLCSAFLMWYSFVFISHHDHDGRRLGTCVVWWSFNSSNRLSEEVKDRRFIG